MKEGILFSITTFSAIGLFVGAFFVPPMAIIDASVLKAGGILLGFGSVAQIPVLAKAGADFKLQHGQTSLSVTNDGKEGDDELDN